jgi:hypothetical protein
MLNFCNIGKSPIHYIHVDPDPNQNTDLWKILTEENTNFSTVELTATIYKGKRAQ